MNIFSWLWRRKWIVQIKGIAPGEFPSPVTYLIGVHAKDAESAEAAAMRKVEGELLPPYHILKVVPAGKR